MITEEKRLESIVEVQFKDLKGGDKFYVYGHRYEKLFGKNCKDELGNIVICDPDSWVDVKK